jgi:hypothetical protein
MNIKPIIALICISSVLFGCSNKETYETKKTTTSVSTSAVTATSEKNTENTQETQRFVAKILGYENEQLTYEYEGETVTVKMPPENFANDSYTKGLKQMSQLIINNDFGEEVMGYIKLNYDGTQAVYCDVKSPNGEDFSNGMLYTGAKTLTIEESEVTMTRIKGSIFKLSNEFGSVTADLNLLNNIEKGNFPDKLDRVIFSGYKFNSGNFIPESVNVFERTDNINNTIQYSYSNYYDDENYSFFGVIQSLENDRATVLLNDSKTLCDVPTYYNDGELYEGGQVMITLESDSELFGSGEEYYSDYAVFHTDPTEYNYPEYDFETLAYAQHSKNDITRYIYTKIEDIQSD